ncbi:unnamed protein product [Linum tenue]|uniref:FAS1 domain-containing protein n=1 Tax=Linum tenue TaxID=586396 RepID=A0AAV0Q9Q5_9ROSI|nr:unnamed protein product [Linum tenue]
MKTQIIISISLAFLLLNIPKTLSLSPAAAPAKPPPSSPAPAAQVAVTPGPLDVAKILDKAGRFTVFLRLLKSTQEDVELYQQLNETHNGATVFAPSDGAFSGLKAGTLNSLSDGDKSELVKYHIVPFFISSAQFQTISGTVYADSRLAIYQVDKVLLPLDVFTPRPPPPAPAPAPAPEKAGKKGGGAESPAVPKSDKSGAVRRIGRRQDLVILVLGVGWIATAVL